MGQKVNPHGMRVGVIKDWDSRWFTSKQAFGDTLVEDYKIRKTLKKQLYAAGVPKIEIERTVDSQTGAPRVKVNVFCAKATTAGVPSLRKSSMSLSQAEYPGADGGVSGGHRPFGAERGKAAASHQPRGQIGRFWSRWPEGKGGVSYRRR